MGIFAAGQKHGRGTEYNPEGFKLYVGTFKDNLRHGHGIAYEVRNSIIGGESEVPIYEGGWRNGMKHGYGVAFLTEGHKYEGSFRYDQVCVVRRRSTDRVGFSHSLSHTHHKLCVSSSPRSLSLSR